MLYEAPPATTRRKSKKTLQYEGYKRYVGFDDEAGLFHGEEFDLRDVITFQGTSVEELEKEFRDFVVDYLEFCGERGEESNKIFRSE